MARKTFLLCGFIVALSGLAQADVGDIDYMNFDEKGQLVPVAKNQYYPRVATDGSQYLVVYQHEYSSSDNDIYACVINKNGEPIRSFAVNTSSDNDYQPDVAYLPTKNLFLVVWQRSTSNGSQICGRIINLNGTTSNTFYISDGAGGEAQEFAYAFRPRVIFTAYDNVFVCWTEVTNFSYPANGVRAAGRVISVSDANNFSRGTCSHIGYDYAYPVAVRLHTDYILLGWQQIMSRSGNDVDAWVWSTRVRVLLKDGTIPSWYSTMHTYVDSPVGVACTQMDIAFNTSPGDIADDYEYTAFAVWERRVNSTNNDIYGRLLYIDFENEVVYLGTLRQLESSSNQAIQPRVAWGGYHYCVLWNHLYSSTDGDIHAKSVTENGNLSDATLFLAGSWGNDFHPAIASAGRNNFAALYSGYSTVNANIVYNVHHYAQTPPVAIAATNTTSTSFTANWNAVNDGRFLFYTLDVSRRNDFSGDNIYYDAIRGDGTGTSTNLSGLSPNTTYYYRVRWFNHANMGSDVSNTISVTTNTATPTQYTLSLSKGGSGSGTVTVNGTPRSLQWSGTFDSGATVQLQAVPASGSTFANWSGDLTGSETQKNITMNGNKNVTANFSLPITRHPADSSPYGNGNGEIEITEIAMAIDAYLRGTDVNLEILDISTGIDIYLRGGCYISSGTTWEWVQCNKTIEY